MKSIYTLSEINQIFYKCFIVFLSLIAAIYGQEWEARGIYAKKEHSLVKPYQGKVILLLTCYLAQHFPRARACVAKCSCFSLQANSAGALMGKGFPSNVLQCITRLIDFMLTTSLGINVWD